MDLENGRGARIGHTRESARAVPYGSRSINQLRYEWHFYCVPTDYPVHVTVTSLDSWQAKSPPRGRNSEPPDIHWSKYLRPDWMENCAQFVCHERKQICSGQIMAISCARIQFVLTGLAGFIRVQFQLHYRNIRWSALSSMFLNWKVLEADDASTTGGRKLFSSYKGEDNQWDALLSTISSASNWTVQKGNHCEPKSSKRIS